MSTIEELLNGVEIPFEELESGLEAIHEMIAQLRGLVECSGWPLFTKMVEENALTLEQCVAREDPDGINGVLLQQKQRGMVMGMRRLLSLPESLLEVYEDQRRMVLQRMEELRDERNRQDSEQPGDPDDSRADTSEYSP